MNYAIASYSFHRMLESASFNIFDYIEICDRLGCTQLDPWAAHLTNAHSMETIAKVGSQPGILSLEPGSVDFTKRIQKAAAATGLPFGCIAVDGGHIYELDIEDRKRNREIALQWLDVAELLGASQVRIDSGGEETVTEEIFKIIMEGYQFLIEYARPKGIEILVENHWGPTPNPDFTLRLLKSVEGLGLLFDSNNIIKGRQAEGWRILAPFARSVHIKTFGFDDKGTDPTVDIPHCIEILKQAGYNGVWSIESCPLDGNELQAVKKTLSLIQRCVISNK